MKIRAIQDKVIVKAREEENKTDSGIFLASNEEDKGIVKADVISVGPGYYDEKGKFKANKLTPGSVIMFNKGSGLIFTYEDEQYHSITENDVIGILK